MRIDLIPLLQQKEICHPSKIIAATIKNGHLHVKVRGCPWWKEGADYNQEHSVDFHFEDVGDGLIDPITFDSNSDEALEEFSIVPARDVLWAEPRGYAVYCSAPIPRPFEIYVIVADFLLAGSAFLSASNFLQCGSLSQFLWQHTQKNGYLLGRFPPAIRDLVCTELDAQGVRYSQVEERLDDDDLLLVRIGRSQFFCRTALAVYED